MNLPVIILCGGQGTRMGDTLTKKELIDIGGRPLLWHVMRIFSAAGNNHFYLALGHHGDQVRRYFFEYESMTRDVTLSVSNPDGKATHSPIVYNSKTEHPPWQITMVDTGLSTEKGSRIGQMRRYIDPQRPFFVAYGEAVADIDLNHLYAFHRSHNKLATVTGIQVNFQYGVIDVDERQVVTGFVEKPHLPYWINGGFMLFEPEVMARIDATRIDVNLETEILPQLAQEGELVLYQHHGYWQSMKTLKDALTLKSDWERTAPWKCW